MAAQNGHLEAVRLLVEGKADVNAAKEVHMHLTACRRRVEGEGWRCTVQDGRVIGVGGS